MKPILSIKAEKLDKIKDTEHREFVESHIDSFVDYERDQELYGGDIARRCDGLSRSYVYILFVMVDCLYESYDLSERHFELLNIAAIHLERLYREQMATLATEPEQTEVKMILGDYLDKVALIFQTASDKAGSRAHRERYGRKAQEYSARADNARDLAQAKSHIAKMLDLYEKAAIEYRSDTFFVGKLFGQRAEEYRAKYMEEESYAASGAEQSEREPLLSRTGLSNAGLHKRRPYHSEGSAAESSTSEIEKDFSNLNLFF